MWAENNGERGAPVFSILQQMFRVRNLGPEGTMTVYVSDVPREGTVAGLLYPCTSPLQALRFRRHEGPSW